MIHARGCGTSRMQGGIYLVTKLVTGGGPIENFLIDPPVIVPEEMHVPYQGMGSFQREEVCNQCYDDPKKFQSYMGNDFKCAKCKGAGKITVTHIADHIGTSHYPHPIDDIEEVRAIGSSRRIPSSFPFHLLTKDSRHFRCHDKAYIDNWRHYEYWWGCPRHVHKPPWAEEGTRPYKVHKDEMCIGQLWEDYDPQMSKEDDTTVTPAITVTMACGKSFNCNRRPYGVNPVYRRAFYMALPISNIDVVASTTGVHEANYDKARKAGLWVERTLE